MAKITRDSNFIVIESDTSDRISFIPVSEATILVDERGVFIKSKHFNFRTNNIQDKSGVTVIDRKAHFKEMITGTSGGSVAVDPVAK